MSHDAVGDPVRELLFRIGLMNMVVVEVGLVPDAPKAAPYAFRAWARPDGRITLLVDPTETYESALWLIIHELAHTDLRGAGLVSTSLRKLQERDHQAETIAMDVLHGDRSTRPPLERESVLGSDDPRLGSRFGFDVDPHQALLARRGMTTASRRSGSACFRRLRWGRCRSRRT